MARLARVVVPGVPHHVTQRGNRRQATFFSEADYAAYLEWMAEWCRRGGVAVLLRLHERTGRPLGGSAFLKHLETKLGRVLRKKPVGRKPRT